MLIILPLSVLRFQLWSPDPSLHHSFTQEGLSHKLPGPGYCWESVILASFVNRCNSPSSPLSPPNLLMHINISACTYIISSYLGSGHSVYHFFKSHLSHVLLEVGILLIWIYIFRGNSLWGRVHMQEGYWGVSREKGLREVEEVKLWCGHNRGSSWSRRNSGAGMALNWGERSCHGMWAPLEREPNPELMGPLGDEP